MFIPEKQQDVLHNNNDNNNKPMHPGFTKEKKKGEYKGKRTFNNVTLYKTVSDYLSLGRITHSV